MSKAQVVSHEALGARSVRYKLKKLRVTGCKFKKFRNNGILEQWNVERIRANVQNEAGVTIFCFQKRAISFGNGCQYWPSYLLFT